MTRKLFGTDGVRGAVGELLTPELVLALARATTAVVAEHIARPQVLIIRDTRESGQMLEAALTAGVTAAGGDVLLAGVLPTPAAPLLLKQYSCDLAAVISASHNPYRDNGIKFFGADGDKLCDQRELRIEQVLADQSWRLAPHVGTVRALRAAESDYLRILTQRFSELDLSNCNVLLDCANGSTYRVAPEIFRRLGATVTVFADQPDGSNINSNCGSTHIGELQRRVVQGQHELGFAFDGDGDRVLAVDHAGNVVDGDELIALAALHLHSQNRLPGGGVAVTVMTNYGFWQAMEAAGIKVADTQVGDRYVLQALRARGWTLGGEQSGHIIDLNFAPTGDGIASALLTLEGLGGRSLAHRAAMKKLPQKLINVPVQDRAALGTNEKARAAIAQASSGLSGRGRVLVRPSGTEELIRVMVEAPTSEEADRVCDRLANMVRAELASDCQTKI